MNLTNEVTKEEFESLLKDALSPISTQLTSGFSSLSGQLQALSVELQTVSSDVQGIKSELQTTYGNVHGLQSGFGSAKRTVNGMEPLSISYGRPKTYVSATQFRSVTRPVKIRQGHQG